MCGVKLSKELMAIAGEAGRVCLLYQQCCLLCMMISVVGTCLHGVLYQLWREAQQRAHGHRR
jgi:hypothetical protein